MGTDRRCGTLCTTLVAAILILSVGVCLQKCQAQDDFSAESKESDTWRSVDLEDEDLGFLDEDEDSISEHEAGLIDAPEEEQGIISRPGDGIDEFDETDVVVLGSGNFSEFVKANPYLLVNFYAPWCGHCREFAPEYAIAATSLLGVAAVAKVDAVANHKLAEDYAVGSYPSVFFLIDGVHKEYLGQLVKDEIIAWVKMKTRPAVFSMHSKDVAETVLNFQEGTMAISLLNSLESSDAEEFAFAARQVDDVLFYQTKSGVAAEVFNFSTDVKRPALLLLKHEDEKMSWFDGEFKRDVIEEFVTKHKLPLVTTFNKKNAGLIFESPIKKQVILFTCRDDYERLVPDFKKSAKMLQGKLVFVHIDFEDDEQAPAIMDFFGINNTKPVVMGYDATENSRKFLMEGDITTENVYVFGEKFFSNSLKSQYMSDPIPETNDENVKVVVGLNFDSVVLDEMKDVFLEVYAPWCGHCQSLQPTWEKLAQRLRGVESIVIAKMDGTTNEHQLVKAEGYPTLLLYPAGKNGSDPILFDGERRTVKEFVKFLKKEAVIPFKVPRNLDTQYGNDSLKNVESSIGSVDIRKSGDDLEDLESVTKSTEQKHENVFDSLKDEL